MPIFLSNKRPFPKKHTVFMSYFVKKRLFAQKQIALISFFYFFIKNPIAFLPIFGQEIDKRILSRLYYIMDEKS